MPRALPGFESIRRYRNARGHADREAVAGRLLRDARGRSARHRARLVRVRVHPQSAAADRRHESLHVAAPERHRARHVGQRCRPRDALRHRFDGATDQPHSECRRHARRSRSENLRRRPRAVEPERCRRSQRHVRARVPATGRLEGRSGGRRRYLPAPRAVLPAHRPRARAPPDPRTQDVGTHEQQYLNGLEKAPVAGEIDLF